ncbi:hypothetical protein [Serratia marcescens]|uniref:hypothetical protein n=1 Tax=Serratia marcescens TaxID=615 RepID=UPI001114D2D0|nr:hypothetical protein [Serratia marcescens]
MMSAWLVYPNCHFLFYFCSSHRSCGLSGDKNTENRSWKTVARLNDGKWCQNGLKKMLKLAAVDKNGIISSKNTYKQQPQQQNNTNASFFMLKKKDNKIIARLS